MRTHTFMNLLHVKHSSKCLVDGCMQMYVRKIFYLKKLLLIFMRKHLFLSKQTYELNQLKLERLCDYM